MSGNSVNSVTLRSGFRRLAMVAARGPGPAAADHDQTLGHGSSVRYSMSGGAANVFETQHSRRARSMSAELQRDVGACA